MGLYVLATTRGRSMKINLRDYLAGMKAASTAEELEKAIQAPYKQILLWKNVDRHLQGP
jgi:hypothetical protein